MDDESGEAEDGETSAAHQHVEVVVRCHEAAWQRIYFLLFLIN